MNKQCSMAGHKMWHNIFIGNHGNLSARYCTPWYPMVPPSYRVTLVVQPSVEALHCFYCYQMPGRRPLSTPDSLEPGIRICCYDILERAGSQYHPIKMTAGVFNHYCWLLSFFSTIIPYKNVFFTSGISCTWPLQPPMAPHTTMTGAVRQLLVPRTRCQDRNFLLYNHQLLDAQGGRDPNCRVTARDPVVNPRPLRVGPAAYLQREALVGMISIVASLVLRIVRSIQRCCSNKTR